MTISIETFTLAPGFRATAVACGLKLSGNLDLALVAAERPCCMIFRGTGFSSSWIRR